MLALQLSGCAWMEDKPIAIAAHVWLGYEPMFMAREEGWLDTKQVHLVETHSATESLQLLAAGKVDGAALTLDEMLRARADGLPLSAVMIFNVSAGADMLLARSNIKKLADLKGQRVGLEQSSVAEVMLAEVLRFAKLTKQDITLVPMPVNMHLNAWDSHQVDALISYEPVASQLQTLNAVKLFDSRQIPNTIVDVLVIRTDMLDRSHAKAIRHLLSAHFQALEHLTHNPQDAAYRMAPHLGLPADYVISAYKGLQLPNAAHNYQLMSGSKPELLANASKLSKIMFTNKLLKQNDALTSLIHAEFLPTDFLNADE